MTPIQNIFTECFWLFAADENLFYKFLWLYNKTGNDNSSFWWILKTTSLKIRSRETRKFETSRLEPVISLKINFDCFCFCLNTFKYHLTSTEDEKRKSYGKTMILGRSVSNKQCSTVFTKFEPTVEELKHLCKKLSLYFVK